MLSKTCVRFINAEIRRKF